MEWTDEFLSMENIGILKFFESKDKSWDSGSGCITVVPMHCIRFGAVTHCSVSIAFSCVKSTGARAKGKETKAMDRKYLETAVILARMYGVAETLNPWEYMENGEFIAKIEKWTDEFLSTENTDLLKFFESKVK